MVMKDLIIDIFYFQINSNTRGHNQKLEKREHISTQVRQNWFANMEKNENIV